MEGMFFFASSIGKLSGKKIKELQAGARVKLTKPKKMPDFVLWKASKENEPAWDSI